MVCSLSTVKRIDALAAVNCSRLSIRAPSKAIDSEELPAAPRGVSRQEAWPLSSVLAVQRLDPSVNVRDMPDSALSQMSVSVAATVAVVTIRSGLSYTGPLSGDVDDAVTLTAQLSADSETAIPAATVTFALGSVHCTATTDITGTASCPITPNQAAGTYPLTVVFAGDARFGAATASTTFTVTKEETKVAYTGATTLRNGESAELAATLTADGVRPLSGRALTLGIGSGSTSQTCTATTNEAGSAGCSIAIPHQPVGGGMASATFAGDDRYRAAGDQAATQVSAAAASPAPSASPPKLATTGEPATITPTSVLIAGLLLCIGGLLLLLVPRRRRGDPPSIVWRNRE